MDTVMIFLLQAAIGIVAMTPFLWVANKTVGLNAKPDRRAMLTTIVGYAGASLVLIFAGVGNVWLGAVAPIPGALLTYYWLRRTYRKGWVDDDAIPEGERLENNDWRVGLGVVAGVVLAALIKTLILR